MFYLSVPCKWMCSLQLPVSSVLSALFVALHYSLSDDTNLNKIKINKQINCDQFFY